MAEGKRTTTSLTTTGRRSLLPIHPNARVYGLPIISGHVGADAAACMLAIDLAHEDRLVAIMDIGTNTELLVGNRHRILAASCPAGPAFEGGAIACGMPGLDGAIEDVALERRRDVPAWSDRRRAAGGHLRIGARRSDERAAADRTHERDGPLRGRSRPGHARRRARYLFPGERRQRAGAGERAPTSPACRSCSATTASSSTTSPCSIWREVSAAI